MGEKAVLANTNSPDQDRIDFIEDCLRYDIPRLESTIYPDGVGVFENLCYCDEPCEDFLYDLYTPLGAPESKVAFFMLHGGAFVYGDKVNNKNFGMHLALKSGLPVVNINYRKLPDTDCIGMFDDIALAIRVISEKHGFDTYHFIGDSAGGYLAVMASYLATQKEVREELGIEEECDAKVASIVSICGTYGASPETFPGYFFAEEEEKANLPEFVFDLSKLVDKYGIAPIVAITGDKDFLRDENYALKDRLEKQGTKVPFFEGISEEGKDASHIYPVVDPQWSESIKAIGVMLTYV